MDKCLIIGGGISGLSASVYLCKLGYKVELIEAAPKLGGRAYSFYDNHYKTEIDNGQHIFMGAYSHTFDFLKLCNSLHLVEFQKKLRIVFITRNGIKAEINASKYFYPLNLLYAIWHYKFLSASEKIKIVKLILFIPFMNSSKLISQTVLEWLDDNGQSENAIKSFWGVVAVGALNSNIKEASAILFAKMLKKIFLNGNKSSTIVLPLSGLSKIFVDPTLLFLEKYDFNWLVSESVTKLEVTDRKVVNVKTNKREISNFDHVIFATQPHNIDKIISSTKLINYQFNSSEFSSITSVTIGLKTNIFDEKFYSLIDSIIHWVFIHENYISIVISSSSELNLLSNVEIEKNCITELEQYFPKFDKNLVLFTRVVKEKRATIKSTPKFEIHRKSIKSNFENLHFIGDWTDTQLPQTIESAVKSGYSIAEKIAGIK